MNKDRKHSVLPYVVTSGLLIVMAVGAELLYGITKYQAFVLFAQMCLFPALLNLFVMLSRMRMHEGMPAVAEADAEQTEAGKPRGAWLHRLAGDRKSVV